MEEIEKKARKKLFKRLLGGHRVLDNYLTSDPIVHVSFSELWKVIEGAFFDSRNDYLVEYYKKQFSEDYEKEIQNNI